MDFFYDSKLTNFLLYFVTTCAIAFGVQLLWKRRQLYIESIRLPGPFALPILGSALQLVGNPYHIHCELTNMFNKYSPIFRLWLGPKFLYMVSDPKYCEIILSSQSAVKKEELYEMMSAGGGQGLFTAISVPHWRTHRRLIIPTLNQGILDGFLQVFLAQSQVLVKILEKYSGKAEFNVFKVLSKCTLDIIGETAMGVKLNAQTTDCRFEKAEDKVWETSTSRIYNVFYHNDFIFKLTRTGKDFFAATTELRDFTRKILLERKALRIQNKDIPDQTDYESGFKKRKAFLDSLLDVNEEEKFVLTDEDVLDETLTMIVAGTDTLASTDSFVLMMMGIHQNIQEDVLKEILSVVGSTENLNLSHLPQLKLLERVIKETLRLFPIAPSIGREAEDDIDLGDCKILKGFSILIGILNMHRNEKNFPDPCKFDPNRFLPEEIAKRPPAAYIPFSFGPRNCIGIKYAMMAMKVVLVQVLRKYRVFTSYKNVEDVALKSNLVLRPRDGYMVSLELR